MNDLSGNPQVHYQPKLLETEPYLSREYLKLERDRLWRRVWLQAARLEEIPNVGDFVTYEILDDSVIIVRSGTDQVRAFHNVCVHRGRRLIDIPPGARNATGNRNRFICGYHGWNFGLDGAASNIACRQDWQGKLTPENTALGQVRVDCWGGWIWINLDPNCEPLRDYLEPAASVLDHFELQNLRYKWRRWGVFDCNWKVAIEAFIETYHVPATHPEYMKFGVYQGWGRQEGLHSSLGYDAKGENKGRLRLGSGKDARKATAEMVAYTMEHVNSNFSQSLLDAAMRLEDELPETATEEEVLKHWLSSARQADAAQGVVWPTVAPELVARSGVAWNIFPNFRLGHAVNNGLCYQARPYGDDPDKCIFEVSVFELYPEGAAPKTEWVHTPLGDPGWGSVLSQDFSNMAAVQQGMKSTGFAGPRPNPKEEGAVVALHETLATYMGLGRPQTI
ncbi:aromatic ring-hydroxylating oxygenase subunit alpha [Sphingobium sp. B2]|uniref:aromatic ring-hydroxylating oxygenase subunit alpha n=1 Tax=Sphingobium sp. B2 TaxID=2583228 RepID=UPI00119ED4BA|nr:aromatic ring-hydroxylating dioxygenase subunit alpha [Sphingobium sp. B2]